MRLNWPGIIGRRRPVTLISKAPRPQSVEVKRKFSSGENPDRLRRKVDAHVRMSSDANYNSWTRTGLIKRLRELEEELKRRPAPAESHPEPEPEPPAPVAESTGKSSESQGAPKSTVPKKPKGKRKVDPSKYSTRYIALKLAYLGKNYGGFEFQAMGNQPSIEEELWKALTKACLIFPKDERVVDFDCCEYSKCGRTDKGVSAFGQVIGVRVRSNRPLPKKRIKLNEDAENAGAVAAAEGVATQDADQMEVEAGQDEKPFDDIDDELHYPRLLNRVLPPEIRVLAWCPSPPPDFSARFSCRERQYRYFFTQPAFVPDPSASGDDDMRPGWLDIDAMRDAAKRFEGDQDFRNLCKIDAAKQITNFSRRIFEADIVEVKDVSTALPFLNSPAFTSPHVKNSQSDVHPKVYYFHVRGSAFLWHQIRHMVSILFLIGQRLERPSLVTDLLDVQKNPCKPSYTMADEVPLVLWDCIFPADLDAAAGSTGHKDTLDWVYVGQDSAGSKFGQHGVMDSVWQTWRDKKMDELLANQLLQLISQQGNDVAPRAEEDKKKPSFSARLFEGGNTSRMGGKYVPVMQKELQQSPEEQNDRFAKRKGYVDAADYRAQRGIRSIYDDAKMEE